MGYLPFSSFFQLIDNLPHSAPIVCNREEKGIDRIIDYVKQYRTDITLITYGKNTGTFTFESRSDDGSRIYIDDVLVVESWFDQGSTTRSNSIDLSKGEHKIEFWYYENSGFDFMRFRWLANPDGYTVNSEIDAMQFYVK